MKLFTGSEYAVVYPKQTVRGGEVLLIKRWNVMVLHSFLAGYHLGCLRRIGARTASLSVTCIGVRRYGALAQTGVDRRY